MDERTRVHMSRDRTDSILKVVVKQFFVEKEVTSTLVMDSLYSGLKALESQSRSKIKKGKMKLVEGEEIVPAPIVYSENNMFVLSDDVLLLVERAALGPIPLQPLTPKDDKGSLNRTKDTNFGEEFNKDAIERDERRLTEFGRRTLEFLILFHIFSRIDVAHKEAVALKRQEELIREEEAAEQAEIELKAKRSAADREKRAKKKQTKQRRNSRKLKDKTRHEISNVIIQHKHQEQNPPDETTLEESSPKQEELIIFEKFCTEENASDTSETADDFVETIEPELEVDTFERNTNMDVSKFVKQNAQTEKTSSCIVDDSSSTCSTESVPTIVMNGSHKENSFQISRSLDRGKNHGNKDMQILPSDDRNNRSETETVVTLTDETNFKEEKIYQEEATSFQKEPKVNGQSDDKQSFDSKTANTLSSIDILNQSSEAPATPTKKLTSTIPTEEITVKDPHNTTRALPTSSQPITTRQYTSMSRPSSAPLIPPARPSGRLGTDQSPSLPASALPFVPHSYRNAITGTNDMAPSPISFAYHHQSFNQNPIRPGLTFGSMSYRSRDEPSQVVDEFPHMDIIYDLLDDERVIPDEATPSYNYLQSPHFQPNQYINDQAAQFYSRAYGSSQVNQWPYGVTDLSMLILGNNVRDNDSGYGYGVPDYTNGVNGYMYNTRPGNGL